MSADHRADTQPRPDDPAARRSTPAAADREAQTGRAHAQGHTPALGREDRPPGDDHGRAPSVPNSDASVGNTARLAASALFGRDLIAPGPTLWPLGQRARDRRAHAHSVIEEGRRRRAALRHRLDPRTRPGSAFGATWRPVPRRANAAVIASLVVTVLAVFVLAGWPTSSTAPRPASPPPPSGVVEPALLPALDPPVTTLPAPSSAAPLPFTAQAPIPPQGVPALPPRKDDAQDPTRIAVVDPPGGEPSPAELSSPQSAAQAWLARLCPNSYTDDFGAAEQRARPAMTLAGWAQLDPARNERARTSWNQALQAKETSRCSAPTAVVSPEAPRSPTSAIVILQIDRVVTSGTGARWVEPLRHTRVVLRGDDGLWRVDTATEGG